MTTVTAAAAPTTDAEVRHVAAGEGETIYVPGGTVTVKVGGAETRGALTLAEIADEPGGGVPFLHRHAPAEVFYVLEGTYEFKCVRGGRQERIRAGAGATVFIPPSAPHSFQNVGQQTGRLIALLTPGGFEEYVRAIGVGADGAGAAPPSAPDLERIGALERTYGIEWIEQPAPPPG